MNPKRLIPFLALSCLAAGLIPALPSPKRYPADMLRSFKMETNITANVNGDLENVEVVCFKRIEFTGTDPSPLFDELKTITLSTNMELFRFVTVRPRQVQPKLTRKEWEAMQPPTPRP